MKSKGLLLSLVLSFCLVLVAGCGEQKYSITTSVNDEEYGYVTGAGDYLMGAPVSLKVYPNRGCELKNVYFNTDRTNWANVKRDSTNLTEKGYVDVTFTVDNTNIGDYYVEFDCDTEEVNNEAFKTLYKVYFIIDLGGGLVLTNPFNLENITSDGKGYMEISSGSKIKRNISYVTSSYVSNAYQNKSVLFDWYTDATFATEFNYLETPITQEITLYGKAKELTNKNELESAIKIFSSNTAGMTITSYEKEGADYKTEAYETARVYSLGDIKNLQIGVEAGAGTTGTTYTRAYKVSTESTAYYEGVSGSNTSGNKTYNKLNLLDSSKKVIYSLENIDNIYEFIKIKDLSLTSVETSDSCGEASSTSVVSKCYKGTDTTVEYTFKLENGEIKEFMYGNKKYTIDYTAFKNQGLTISSSNQMYLVKFDLYDTNNDISTGIAGLNTFSNVLKVSSAAGLTQNVKAKLDTVEALKGYDYIFTEANGSSCTTTKIDDLSALSITANTTICLKIEAAASEFTQAIENTVDFNIEAELQAFGKTITQKYYYVSDVTSSITGVDAVTEKLLGTLASYISEQNTVTPKFEKNGNSFDVYDDDGTTKLLNIVLIGEENNKKISKIIYIDNGVSYKYMFKGVLENAIENMTYFAYKNGNGEYTLSNSGITGITNYNQDDIFSNLVKIGDAKLTYGKTEDQYKATIDGVGILTITLTDNKEKIASVKLLDVNEEEKATYTFIEKVAYGMKIGTFSINANVKIFGGEDVKRSYSCNTISSDDCIAKDENGNEIQTDSVIKAFFKYLNNLSAKGWNNYSVTENGETISYVISKNDEEGKYKVYEDGVLVLDITLNSTSSKVETIKFVNEGITYTYTFTLN